MYDTNCIHIQQPISSNHFNVRMVDQNNLTYRNLYMSGYSGLPYGHKNKNKQHQPPCFRIGKADYVGSNQSSQILYAFLV